jgi:hypothetical protein
MNLFYTLKCLASAALGTHAKDELVLQLGTTATAAAIAQHQHQH